MACIWNLVQVLEKNDYNWTVHYMNTHTVPQDTFDEMAVGTRWACVDVAVRVMTGGRGNADSASCLWRLAGT